MGNNDNTNELITNLKTIGCENAEDANDMFISESEIGDGLDESHFDLALQAKN
jgi:hypothetical protein